MCGSASGYPRCRRRSTSTACARPSCAACRCRSADGRRRTVRGHQGGRARGGPRRAVGRGRARRLGRRGAQGRVARRRPAALQHPERLLPARQPRQAEPVGRPQDRRGAAIFHQLLDDADVLVTNIRPAAWPGSASTPSRSPPATRARVRGRVGVRAHRTGRRQGRLRHRRVLVPGRRGRRTGRERARPAGAAAGMGDHTAAISLVGRGRRGARRPRADRQGTARVHVARAERRVGGLVRPDRAHGRREPRSRSEARALQPDARLLPGGRRGLVLAARAGGDPPLAECRRRDRPGGPGRGRTVRLSSG